MKKSGPLSPGYGKGSNLPVLKTSKLSPSTSSSKARTNTRSSEDIPKSVKLSVSGSHGGAPARRANSPSGDNRHSVSSGVRYITEDMIRKASKEDSFDMITTLNLMLSKDGGKKIKYIENLEKLKNLQVLNLSNNIIEKMEKLDRLTKLRELNVSYNNITKIDGIENLVNLQVLNLTCNRIEHIPVWLSKKLRSLRILHIAKNNLNSLNELTKLKPLPDLFNLSVSENPLTELLHSRLYLIFHLRNLEVIDGQSIADSERDEAKDRFTQDEVQKLERELEERETSFRRLEDLHSRSLQDGSMKEAMTGELKKKERDLLETIKDLNQELDAKDNLLVKKSKDLNRANEKHYQLEQELAFFKIDKKFDSLGQGPPPDDVSFDDSSQLDESPYIGRARYKANQYARESGNFNPTPQKVEMRSFNFDSQNLLSPRNNNADNTFDSSSSQGEDVRKAEERLRLLQEDLEATERKLLGATSELKYMGDIKPESQIPEDLLQSLREKLAKKMKNVNEMRDKASQIEAELEKKDKSIDRKCAELSQLKSTLQRLDRRDPQYLKLQDAVLQKEQQITESQAMENQLHQHLEGMLDTITKETGEIKKIEDKLNDGGIEHTAELRYELGDIVDGLQDYLAVVRSQGDKKQIDVQKLLDEKHDYQDKIKQLEAELGVLDREAASYKQMEHSYKELENALAQADAQNASLKDQLAKTKQQEPMIEEKIVKTEAERQHLQRSLKDVERRTQNEKQQLERQLNQERERAEKAGQKARELANKEHELKRITNQLESAKALNASLKEQLEENRRRVKDAVNDSLSPIQLKRRLKDVSATLKRNRSPIEPEGPEDVVGKTFKDLQQHLQTTLNKSMKEVDSLKKEKDRTDTDILSMREQLKKYESKLTKKEEQRHDEKIKREEEKKNTNAEIKKLQEEARQMRAAVKDAENRARRARSATKIVHKPESLSSRDTLNTFEKGLYDELQNELMDLKRLMQQKEEDNSKKLLDLETETKGLQAEIGQRDKEVQREKTKQKQQEDLQKERQEARLDVLAKDLEQAQQSANFLQQMLDDREYQLHDELQQANLSGQMVSMQEEELARLYEILEAQRNEIENLNGELDQMYHHGPGVGGFDDELWRLRNEVDSLKETLAMQTAYVQNMPNLRANTGVQVDSGIQGGRGSIGVDAQQRSPLSKYRHPTMSMVPPGVPKANAGTTYETGDQFRGGEWIGTERKEQRTPQGDKMFNKEKHFENEFIPSRSTRPSNRGLSLDDMAINGPLNNRQQFSANLPVFEPIQKPHFLSQPHLATTAPPDADIVDGQRRATYHSSSHYQEPSDPLSNAVSMPAVSSPSKFRPVHGSTPAVPPLHLSQNLHQSSGQVHKPAAVIVDNSSPIAGSQSVGFVPQGSQDTRRTHTSPGIYTALRPAFLPTKQTQSYIPTAPVAAPQPTVPVVSAPPPTASYAQPGFQPVVGASAPLGYTTAPNIQPAVAGVIGSPPAYEYVPAGPAQMLPYSGGRVYIPSGGNKPARYYYSSKGAIPMPAPTAQPIVGSPVRVLPVSPIAAGTPISYSPVRVNGYVDPPSPIRPVAMESPSHGIIQAGNHTADGYLFCNVPEHHDLEDYISELQEKLKRLKAKISRSNLSEEILSEEDLDEDEEINRNDSRLIKRLKGELAERRDELESLDLAIERQKHNLRNMKFEEQHLERERREAKDELHFIKTKNRRKRNDSSDDSFDEVMKLSRQKYIKDEIKCLESTLIKRKTQLRDADKILKECNSDLKEAREQARDTVQRYDDAKAGLQMAVGEASELDKRATEAGMQLVKSTEQLSQIRNEVRNLERKRQKQETLLREINQIISKKDSEFKDIDSKVRSSTQNLHKLQADLNAASLREKQTLSALRESEDVLAKRRSEISRLREQTESQRLDIEKLDQLMGKKKTELQLIDESMERKQTELGSILREAEAEIAIKQRDLREQREELQDLDAQKMDVTTTLKNKRAELSHIREEVELEDEVLQKLISAVNKQKAELKHTYEMQKLEQNELDTLKVQHSQKLSELEKTQKLLLSEKSDLEQLNLETSRKSSEVDRLRAALEQDRSEVERMTQEKQSLEDRISALSREREMLDEGCKSVDNKLNNMKKNKKMMEEKIDHSTRRLEQLEVELRYREKEMEEANNQKVSLQKDIQTLKLTVKDHKNELKAFREHIREAEEMIRQQEMDLQEQKRQRDDMKLDMDRMTEGLRLSKITSEDVERQQEMKQEELENLMRSVEKKDIEYQEAKRVLSKVRNEVQREEGKLNQLVSSAHLELESLKNELAEKKEELNESTKNIENIKREAGRLQASEGAIKDLQHHVHELEREIDNKNEEKKELATALTRSYEELQKLRFASEQELEKAAAKIRQLEDGICDLKGQLDGKQKDFDNLKKQSSLRLCKLQTLAEEQFIKASHLSEELRGLKNEKHIEEPDQHIIPDEIAKTQEIQIQHYIDSIQSEINEFAPSVENKENLPSVPRNECKNERIIDGLTEEQDLLKHQLKQQMNRHCEVLQNARLQSEGTIENLKRKLNTLQEVILNTGDSAELRAITERARSRSRSPAKSTLSGGLMHGRGRSASPGLNRHGYLAQRPRSRSRSGDRISSPVFPEREFLTV